MWWARVTSRAVVQTSAFLSVSVFPILLSLLSISFRQKGALGGRHAQTAGQDLGNYLFAVPGRLSRIA
jgi:hypothetical protein